MAECALSIVLLISGGLLLNSLVRLGSVDPGFDPDGVAVISVVHPETGSAAEITRFFDDVMDGMARIPGVHAVGATANLPLSGNSQMLRVNAQGLALSADDEAQGGYPVNYQQVSPGYFDAMDITLRSGRSFARTDDDDAPRVAIVNETLARRFAAEGNALGVRFTLSDDTAGMRPIEIVGVVEDTRQQRLDTVGEGELYLPFAQRVSRAMEIVARGSDSAGSLLPSMRQQVWDVRPDLPVRRSVDMTRFVAQSVADRRFFTLLVGVFAFLALALTVVGIYGTLAFAVTQRRGELGVRLALGATGGSVLRTVLIRATRTVTAGVGIGVGASLLATRLLESMLFGVTTTDPLTLGLSVTTVLGAALAGAIVPARRAARIAPAIALRRD
jgi:putative ABC transport system permease protein